MELCCPECQGLFGSIPNLAALDSYGGLKYHNVGSLNSSALRGCPICKIVEGELPEDYHGKPDIPLVCHLATHTTHRSPENVHDPHPWCDRQAGFSIYFTREGFSTVFGTCFLTVEADNPAAKYVLTRPVPQDLRSETVGAQLCSWLRDGDLSKVDQDFVVHTDTSSGTLPTRVVDVEVLRLYQSRPNEIAEYACLSYCWGGPQAVLTTKENLKDHTQSLTYDALPPTLRDAIDVTRRLHIRYLWIDALCIIQDSPEDKAIEIGKMGEIYYNSTVTIAAATAWSVNQGFLQTRDRDVGINLPFYVDENTTGEVTLLAEVQFYNPQDPLNTRAWVLQESILPNKQIIYSKRDILLVQQGISPRTVGSSPRVIGQVLSSAVDLRVISPQYMHRYASPADYKRVCVEQWQAIVRDLTDRGITDPEDRLPAVGGIAQVLQKFWGDDDKYVVGMWQANLIQYLAWLVRDNTRPRPKIYRAPSWSWAALDSSVKFVDLDGPKAKVIKCHTTPQSESNPFGSATSGHLTLLGKMIKGSALTSEQHMKMNVTYSYDTIADREEAEESELCLFLLGFEGELRAVGLILMPLEDGHKYVRKGIFRLNNDGPSRSRSSNVWSYPNARTVTITIY